MKGILVRVGIDSSYGHWNAPVDPNTLNYVYVPIPENPKHQFREGMGRKYSEVVPELISFSSRFGLDLWADLKFPRMLCKRIMHLDPDFQYLTYGDNGERRGKGITSLEEGDFIAFYAGLKPIKPLQNNLMYSLIGYFEVSNKKWAKDIPKGKWNKNAHTRKEKIHPNDIIIIANPIKSGRFSRCIPIGEYRNRAYRVTESIIEQWGGLKIKDGYLQRSANPPLRARAV